MLEAIRTAYDYVKATFADAVRWVGLKWQLLKVWWQLKRSGLR